MTDNAGEKAQKTEVFHCAKCGEKVSVEEDHKIPKRPNGHTEFGSRTHEPGNKLRVEVRRKSAQCKQGRLRGRQRCQTARFLA